MQAVGGLLGELGDADIADVAVLDMRAHRLNLDDVADDLEVERRPSSAPRMIFSVTAELIGAAHLVDRLVERQALHALAVDADDDVAGLDAGLGRRRVVDRRDDLDHAVLLGHLDAEAAELALGLHLHVAIGLGVHVARMRIERGQHAVDRGLDQLGFVGLLDVVGADLLEHVAEQIELTIGVGRRRVGARAPL